MKTKTKVETVGDDGNPVTLEVRLPSAKATKAGDLAYAVEHARLVDAGVLLRSELEHKLRERGVWDRWQARYDAVTAKIAEEQAFLPDDKGETTREGTTLDEARAAAVRIRVLRNEQMALLGERGELTATSVESIAEDARFAALVAECTFDAAGKKPYFEGVDAYVRRIQAEDGRAAASALAGLVSGQESDSFAATFPENKFLTKYKLANEKLELVDGSGRPVDVDGKVIEPAAPAKRFALVVPAEPVCADAPVEEAAHAAS